MVCMVAPKDHIVLPCLHMCACEACAQHLLKRWPGALPGVPWGHRAHRAGVHVSRHSSRTVAL